MADRYCGTGRRKKSVARVTLTPGTGIQVYIGEEAPVESLKDCSVVTATYEIEDGIKGTIGIVGPKRMDYDKVVGTLMKMKNQLDDLYKKG